MTKTNPFGGDQLVHLRAGLEEPRGGAPGDRLDVRGLLAGDEGVEVRSHEGAEQVHRDGADHADLAAVEGLRGESVRQEPARTVEADRVAAVLPPQVLRIEGPEACVELLVGDVIDTPREL
jgi:hypothetical protein